MKRSREEEEYVAPELPLDVWGEVFSYLRYYDIQRTSRVCRVWHAGDFVYRCVKEMKASEVLYIDDLKLAKLKNLKKLAINGWQMKYTISASILASLRHLHTLKLVGILLYTNSYQIMSALTSLKLDSYASHSFTNKTLCLLTQLKKLHFLTSVNDKIDDSGLRTLTNLTSLKIGDTQQISGECLSRMPNLRKLNLNNNLSISGTNLSCLTVLQVLKIAGRYSRIDGSALHCLVGSLRSLDIARGIGRVNRNDVLLLTRLSKLDISDNAFIDNDTLIKLSGQLTALSIDGYASCITERAVSRLTNLTTLSAWKNTNVTTTALKPLIGLTSLTLHDNISSIVPEELNPSITLTFR